MWVRLTALGVACVMLSLAARALAAERTGTLEEIWLAAELNGQALDDIALYLRDPAGGILAPLAQVKSWRMRPPQPQHVVSYRGEQFVPLNAFAGLTYRVDEENQTLLMTAPAALFEQVTLRASNDASLAAPRPPIGGFFNYDLVAAEVNSQSELNGLLEASLFSPAGAGVVHYLARRAHGPTQVLRLDSAWTVDNPETASSFRVGDSITGASAWGGAVRFGGIQWASNYTTRPGFITMPLPSVGGEAVLPSTLSLYVDNALRMQNALPNGPFRIEDIPVITGEGDVRIVVRDLLGREQVITEPYYASPQLLRAGLQEYSLETGFERENYALVSNDYGRPLLVATDRIGLTDHFTGEAHAELVSNLQSVGLSGAMRLSSIGVFDLSVATSRSAQGTGALAGAGFERSARWLSLGGQIEYATHAFQRLGTLPTEPQQRLSGQIFGIVGLGHLGSLSASYTLRDYYRARPLGIFTLRDSVNVGWLGFLSLSLIRTQSDTTVALSLTHAINARTTLSATTSSDSTGSTTEVDLQRNLPAGRGVGYRLIADAGAIRAFDGTVDVQGDVGTYELEARKQSDNSLAQISAIGGIAILDSHVFPTRQIDGSFAVVQVGDASNVRVYRENQLVGQTGASGTLLVPGLRAYQDNSLSIEQADLPLDVVINSVQAEAVPHFRSGVVVNFPIEHPRGALLAVRLENGEPLPTGAQVKIETHDDEFPSGTNGEVYVTGLGEHNDLRAEWRGHSCRFSVQYSPSADPLPRLGPYVCKSVVQ